MPHPDRDAPNQALRREVNGHIAEIATGWGEGVKLDLLCECGRPECLGLVRVPISVYRAARATPHRLIVFRDHRPEEHAPVVEERGDFVVVELVVPAGATAERTD